MGKFVLASTLTYIRYIWGGGLYLGKDVYTGQTVLIRERNCFLDG